MDVPVYMVTADASEALIERVRAVGATGHILKPINLRILKRTLAFSFQNLDPTL
jgi:AmiR/NasT family two-component response regulator